jgi:hypothetical protein
MSNWKDTAAIICREVLDILDSNETNYVKCDEIRDLINSWVTVNNLNVENVQRDGNVYMLQIEEEKEGE